MLLTLALALATAHSPAAPAADTTRADQEVRQAVLRNVTDVKRCYVSEGLRRNPGLEGLVEVELTILPTGAVEHVNLGRTTIAGAGAPEVTACIATVARNWRFERGPFVVELVIFPFYLSPEHVRGPQTRESAS